METMEKRVEEKLDNNYDRLADEYDKTYHFGPRAKIRNLIIFSTLDKLLQEEPKKVLDAGGGTGFFSIPYAKKGHQVVVLDISERMLEKAVENAKKNGALTNVRTVRGSMDNLEFPDHYFDVILCHLAFGYTEPSKTLSEFHRVLTQGGYLSLTVANKDFHIINESLKGNLIEAGKILESAIFRQSPPGIPPIRTFTRSEIVKLCTDARFKVLHVKGIRIVSDYTPELPKETQTLENLEMKLSEKEEFSSIGRHMYLLCKK
jgi:S-adenosylmethionine-dependent methyltransferase